MGSLLSKYSETQGIKKSGPQETPTYDKETVQNKVGQPNTDSTDNGPIIQHVFGQPRRDPNAGDDHVSFPLDRLDLSSISDQELARLFTTAPKLHQFGAVEVVRLSKSIVVKGGRGVSLAESQNMIFAAESLHLPVPRVHRTFTADIPDIDDEGLVKGHFIVMDYVPGPTVDECWESLDLSQQESVASQVAIMIETMQSTSLKLPPGPMGGTGGEKFEGPWFTDYGAGPFATVKDLQDWCNHKIDVCIRYKQLPRSTPRFKFRKLVLTHQDIAPRNLILDAQGKVWMIDWGLAGAYPPGFEQAVLQVDSGRYSEFAEKVLAKLSNRQKYITKLFFSIGYGLTVAARQ